MTGKGDHKSWSEYRDERPSSHERQTDSFLHLFWQSTRKSIQWVRHGKGSAHTTARAALIPSWLRSVVRPNSYAQAQRWHLHY